MEEDDEDELMEGIDDLVATGSISDGSRSPGASPRLSSNGSPPHSHLTLSPHAPSMLPPLQQPMQPSMPMSPPPVQPQTQHWTHQAIQEDGSTNEQVVILAVDRTERNRALRLLLASGLV